MRDSEWTSLVTDDGRLPTSVFAGQLFLFLMAVIGGLWQVADPRVTIAVVGLVIPLGVIGRLPRNVIPAFAITVCQYVLAAAAVFWGTWRLPQAPPDLALTEAIAVLGLVMIPGRASQTVLLSSVSLLLIAYGGIGPRRAVYLPALFSFLCVGVLLLYRTRTARLVGDAPIVVPGEDGREQSPKKSMGEWGYRFVHFVLFLVLWALFVVSFPASEQGFLGLVPVSYDAPDHDPFVKDWKNWSRSWGDGEGDENMNRPGQPMVYEYDGETGALIQAEEDLETTLEGRNGSGRFSSMGKERVFRVRCSERLYWLVRLYDLYDGDTWQVSPQLSRRTHDTREEVLSKSRILVDQDFFIDKYDSSFLPGAYRAVRVGWSKRAGSAGNVDCPPGLATGGGIARLVPMTSRSWEYRVSSRMVCAADTPPAGDMVSDMLMPPNQSRRLPGVKLSRRVRNLASLLTSDYEDDLAKATAIRDYLRTNLRYTLTPLAIPEDAEPVDHFLFENREGFCVHFAQSMAILCRLAGLPARFATGFTPGKYNVLTGTFDVYQYHAHAWCMVWVNPYGWMTFDPTPPSSLDLDAMPPLLGKIWDPFKDDIESRPPEFSLDRTRAARDKAAARLKQRTKDHQKRFRDLVRETVTKPRDLTWQKSTIIAQKGVEVLFRRIQDFSMDITGRTTAWFAWIRQQGESLMRALAEMCEALSYGQMTAALMSCALGFVIARKQDSITGRIATWQKRRRCEALWEVQAAWRDNKPEDVVVECCHVICTLLDLAGYVRRPTEDLLDFARSLQRSLPAIGAEAQTVFEVFNTYQFGARELTQDHAGVVYRASSRLRRRLLADA